MAKQLASRGFTLIEMLVSLCLLTTIVFGMFAMQLDAVREAKQAFYLAEASQQIHNLVERLQISHNDPDLMIEQWNRDNNAVLLNGVGNIENLNPLSISLFWGDKTSSNCSKIHIGKSSCLHIELG